MPRILETGVDLVYSAINRCTHAVVLNVSTLPTTALHDSDVRVPAPFRLTRVSEGEALRWALDPSADLTESFVRDACAKGDRCYGVCDGDQLAGYAWASSRPTHFSPRLLLTFPEDWTYFYKAFTMPAYRGHRLHAALTAMRLADAASRKTRGGFVCVEVNNVRSARSFARMGATRVGTLAALQAGRRYWTCRTSGCRACGFNVRNDRVAARGFAM